MNASSGQRPQFSIMTALLLTLLAALLVGLVFQLGEYRKLEADYVALDVEYHQYQKDAGARIKSLEQRFTALHAAPVIGVHLNGSEYRPLLFKIATTVDAGNELDTTVGNGKDAFQLSDESKVNGLKYWEFGGHIQRIGTIRGADSYRLIFHPTMNLKMRENADGQLISITDGKEQMVYAEYEGESKIIYNDPTLVIVMGPNRKSVVDRYMKFYPQSLHSRLEKSWEEPALVVTAAKER